ncbi:MAG: DinB family protein [Dehalococcoidia bacterium]
MASADELRNQIKQHREALREALQGVKSWEDGSDDSWGAKRIAQHVVRSEVGYANRVSRAMEGKPQDWGDVAFESAADALAKEEDAAAMMDKALRYVEDRDLKKRAEVPGPYSQDVEGAMTALAAHLNEHATELKKM